MPITGQQTRVNEDGTDKDALTVTFTNGAKEQLDQLKDFFKAPNELEVVKLAIGFLQRVKEIEEKNKNACK